MNNLKNIFNLKMIFLFIFMLSTTTTNLLASNFNVDDFCFTIECQKKQDELMKQKQKEQLKKEIVENKSIQYKNKQQNINSNSNQIISSIYNQPKVVDKNIDKNINKKMVLTGVYIKLADGKRIKKTNLNINKNGVFYLEHILSEGETINNLAYLYKVPINKILKFNNLNENTAKQLIPDTIIKIPFQIRKIKDKDKIYSYVNINTINKKTFNNSNNITSDNVNYFNNKNDIINNDIKMKLLNQAKQISFLKSKILILQHKLAIQEAGYRQSDLETTNEKKQLILKTMKFMSDVQKYGKEKALYLNEDFVNTYLKK